ncbi:MAG: polyprenyl synthetase family protein [Ilumatobacteraceae bacterium]
MISAPTSLRDIAARVDERLRGFLAAERVRWTALDPDTEVLVAELERMVLAGGKRLRPAFTHWGFVGAGGDAADPRVVDAGAAFELMHAFALFHDDIMDGSLTRRGARTTHEVHKERHTTDRLAGDARRFGDGVGILVGDLAFVYADAMLVGSSPQVWSMWNELRIELNVGQYLDMLGSARTERSRAKAERICRYKSGKYTIERPLHLGALLAGPENADQLLTAYSAYGLPLGDAFQMRDDVMGAFGDPVVTGKPVGDDLREGKPTPLMAIAVARADAAQRRMLDRVGAGPLSDVEVADVQAVIRATGALDEMEATIDRLTTQAIDAITAAPVTADARAALVDLANFVAQRSV